MKKVLEKMMEDFNCDSLDYLIYSLCENEAGFGVGYVFSNPIPPYGLRKDNKELYEELLGKYKEERNTSYQEFVDNKKAEYGYGWVEQRGGGEGGSEYCYGVFKLGGKYYKAEYSYYSYNGYEYNGISDTLVEVKPVEKTITVFEKV